MSPLGLASVKYGKGKDQHLGNSFIFIIGF